MRRLALLPLLLATLAASADPVAPPPEPSPSDRWSWNARERTAAGIERLDEGDAADAVEAFDAAARLAPANPVSRFNAGTARIGTDAKAAAAQLGALAEAPPAGLETETLYNLGSARLAAGDPRGAVDALVRTLRREPGHLDAKVNLELALRQLEQQQQRQDSSSQDSQQPPDSDRPPPDGPDGDDDPQREPQPDGDRPAPPGESPRGEPPRPSPLPEFKDVPDMTAEQAAAILAAVEDLERQKRREDAEKTQAARATGDRDW